MGSIYEPDCGPSSSGVDYQAAIMTALQNQQQQLASVMLPIYTAIDQQLRFQASELKKVDKRLSSVINARLRDQQSALDTISQQLYTQIAARVTEQGIRLNLLQEQISAGCATGSLPAAGVLTSTAGEGVTPAPGGVSVTVPVSLALQGPAQGQQPSPSMQQVSELTQETENVNITNLSQISNVTENLSQQTTNIGKQIGTQNITETTGGEQYPIGPPQTIVQVIGVPVVVTTPPTPVNVSVSESIWNAINVPAEPPPEPQPLPPPTPPAAIDINNVVTPADQLQPIAGITAQQFGDRVVDPFLEPVAWQFGGFNRRWRSLVNNYFGEWWSRVQMASSFSDLPLIKEQMTARGK